ncbi:Uncharacterised protein [Metamycoplasma cloacale]|uniref:Uncharacterized protein n=1 Tax=Metamycoplasma cloacale TaxID=92401 RepID=A0A2Z4LLV8_9BACT|nr:hypothetical protein [Metamycoplasma cloacale]AWX42771.1 hypothetical protein DK849_01685 [Metamycoplasma cloacale]VEU79414.1 Uncharacterised protein [Metamycoplasma cloacale]
MQENLSGSQFDPRNYKSESEFYDEHKKSIILWFLLPIVIFVISLILYVAGIVEFVAHETVYHFRHLEIQGNTEATWLSLRKSFIIVKSITACFYLGLFIWMITSLSVASKSKSLSRFSFLLLIIVDIVSIISIINFAMNFIYWIPYLGWTTNILGFTSTIIYFAFFVLWTIKTKGYIRKSKQILFFLRMKEENPMFDQFFGSSNGFSFQTENAKSEEQEDTVILADKNEKVENNSTTIDFKQKLQDLNDDQLKTLASKLNIYGYEELNRKELIEKIAVVFKENSDNKPKDDQDNKGEK